MDRWTPTSTPRTPRTPRTQQYVLGTRNSNDQSRRPPSQGRRPPSQGSIRAGIGGGNPWGSDGNARTGGSRNSCIRLPSTNRGPSTPWENHQKRGLQSKRGIGGGGRVTPRSGVGREQLDLINTQQGNKGTETPWSTTRTRGEDSSSPNHQRVTTPRTPFAAPFGAVDLEELIDAHRPGGIASNRSGGGGSSRIGGAPTSIRPSFRGDAGPAAVGDAAAGAGGRGGTLPASRGGSAGHELRNRSSASSSHRQPQPHLTPDGRLLSERHPQSTSAHTQPLLLKPRDISDWTKGSARPRTTAGGKKPRYGVNSEAGQHGPSRRKTNQDNYLMFSNQDDEDFVAAVMDGHGEQGHHVSRFVKDELSPELLKCYNKLPSQPDIDSGVATASTTEAIVQNAFDTVTTRLQRAAINAQASGSTTVACARKGDTLLVANVGDSRAVLGRRDADFGNQIRAVPLTVDHNLDTNKHEVARVRQIGGEVEPIYIPGAGFRGPARLWSKRQQAGGLAVSRSFGDIHLRAAGVSSVPEVRMQKIQQEDKFVILASDGVWDFMTNQEACDIVGKKKDPREASKALVAVARERWQRQGGNNYVDDVTALVANLNPFNRG